MRNKWIKVTHNIQQYILTRTIQKSFHAVTSPELWKMQRQCQLNIHSVNVTHQDIEAGYCFHFMHKERVGRMDKTFLLNAGISGVRIPPRAKRSLRTISVDTRVSTYTHFTSTSLYMQQSSCGDIDCAKQSGQCFDRCMELGQFEYEENKSEYSSIIVYICQTLHINIAYIKIKEASSPLLDNSAVIKYNERGDLKDAGFENKTFNIKQSWQVILVFTMECIILFNHVQ